MRTSRIRHKGKNEHGFMGWIDKESIHFESGMSVLLGDLKSLIETKVVSQEKVVDAFKKIWCFIEFNEEKTTEELELRRKWFLNVVWSKGWRVVATELKRLYNETRNCLWANSCFFPECRDWRSDRK